MIYQLFYHYCLFRVQIQLNQIDYRQMKRVKDIESILENVATNEAALSVVQANGDKRQSRTPRAGQEATTDD